MRRVSADANHEDHKIAEQAALAKVQEAWGDTSFEVTDTRSDWVARKGCWSITVFTSQAEENS